MNKQPGCRPSACGPFLRNCQMQNLHLINRTERSSPEEESVVRVSVVPPSASGTWIQGESAPANTAMQYSDYFGCYAFVQGDNLLTTKGDAFSIGSSPNFWALSPGGDLVVFESGNNLFVYDIESETKTTIQENFGSVIAAAFRNDNKFVAVASPTLVKTYASNGDVEGSFEVGDVVDIAWNPNGTWLAVGAGNKVFFREKNCCPRQELEFEENVISVSWSYHMDVLAVHLQSKVVLLQSKNRVFHRKFEIINPEADFGKVIWSQSALAFCLLSQGGRIFDYEFNKCADSDDNAIYVINGNVLQISDWSRSLIPPPMCHRKQEFDSQISCIASNNDVVAVFTNTRVVFGNDGSSLELPDGPVQCACFREDKLVFAVGDTIWESDGKSIGDCRKMDGFVSFLTPSYVVLSQVTVLNGEATRNLGFPAQVVVQNGNDLAILGRGGVLEFNGEVKSRTAHTMICTERLLSYIDEGVMHHIIYCGNETAREVEPSAELLFFVRKLFSVVIQMNRGNIETVAPHVIVEAALRELIGANEYGEALRISKRYQVIFSRFISLGKIDLNALCSQITDFQLGQFISGLKPMEVPSEMTFVLDFMRFILDAAVDFDAAKKVLTFGEFDSDRELAQKFPMTFCICCILLESAPSAVAFACAFNSSDKVKETINFLLTLFDANELYDISLRTYDPRCITTVALVTMKEPSTYVNFVEELKEMQNPHLKMAVIDENLGNYSKAIHEYALCGPEYVEKCVYLITREKLFDDGIDAYSDNKEIKERIMLMRLDHLESAAKNAQPNKQQSEADARCAAMTALELQNNDVIVRFIPQIVRCKDLWRMAVAHVDNDGRQKLCEALTKAKNFTDAAEIYHHYLGDAKKASELYVKAQEWAQAVECGMPPAEMAQQAFKILAGACKKNIQEARRLKERFVEVLEKQKEHPESTAKKGKNRDKRGLPSIVAQIQALLPSQERKEQYEFVQGILRGSGHQDLADELRALFRDMVRAIWPVPHLPDNEEMPVPEFLRGIL